MKTQAYDTFWQKIHATAQKNSMPLRVMFELTYQCNFKCPHCYVPPNYKKKYARMELGTKDVFLILDQFKRAGCFYLGFTGGEPLMRRDFNKILAYARRLGFEIIIYSNGSMIDEARAKYFKNIGVNKVDITIPGMSEKVFEAVSGVSGSHKKVFQAIEFLHTSSVPLGFKSCLLKENKYEMDAIQKFARSLNASHRLSDKLLPRLGSSSKPCTMSCSACGAGIFQAGVTPAGELKKCVMLEKMKYKILNSSLMQCWERLKNE